jgi:hypothetical protein
MDMVLIFWEDVDFGITLTKVTNPGSYAGQLNILLCNLPV